MHNYSGAELPYLMLRNPAETDHGRIITTTLLNQKQQ